MKNHTRARLSISLLGLMLILVFTAVSASPVTQISSFGPGSGDYRSESYPNGDRYEGYFSNGVYHGSGTYTWANGDVYTGEFRNGQIEGNGRLTLFGKGEYWEGTFTGGQINTGNGIFYWGANGDKFDGTWINGKPEGVGIQLHPDGTSNKVTYQNGVLVEQIGGTAGGNQSQYSTGPAAGSPYANLRVGDVVTMGRYEQDNNYNNGSEPVQWRVLDIRDGRALLLSVYGLETMAYHWNAVSVTWENCSLRAYLNSNFYNGVFADNERQWILQTWNNNPNSARYGTYGGNNTYDYVFLLSQDEIRYYFPTEPSRKTQPTAVARAHGAYGTADVNCAWWWLRSPGMSTSAASSINSIGVLLDTGPVVNDVTGMIRPAMWINLS